jgi:hypothetical protein
MKASEATPVMSAENIDRSKIVLTAGYHETREEGMNALEAAAYLAGQEHSERPYGVCPIIIEMLRSWSDHLPEDGIRTRLHVPLLPTILNTYATPEMMLRRSWMAVDWLVRVYTAAWLELAGLAAHASALRALTPIVDMGSAEASKKATRAARVAWYASKTAARTAARAAKWIAAWDAWYDDAMYAALAVARYTARGGARNAARYTGLCTADVVNWDPASDGAWVAMTRKLTPLVATLQASAVDVVERMAAVKSAPAPVEGAGAGSRTSRALPTRATRQRSPRPRPR